MIFNEDKNELALPWTLAHRYPVPAYKGAKAHILDANGELVAAFEEQNRSVLVAKAMNLLLGGEDEQD